ncbi:MAG: hypothetical protein H6741_02630 [Alphaproteobacteria bacterium]|nr:hypothetical protein [Alphaproteobacteria bacterium]MCB9791600.1 hypothetical protein [Alphaproteobacteria bacterium]
MRATLLPAALLLAAGCAEPTIIDGNVAGQVIDEPATAYFGGPFLFFSPQNLECKEVAFVRKIYDAGSSPTDFDFFGVQFAFDEDKLAEGVYSVEGDGVVAAKALLVQGGAFQEFRARTGTLTVDNYEDEHHVDGAFDIGFGDDGSLSTTYFDAEFCVNLTR